MGNGIKFMLQPGDMILYESALCKHAEKEIFAGNFFRNFYIHYKLNDFTLLAPEDKSKWSQKWHTTV